MILSERPKGEPPRRPATPSPTRADAGVERPVPKATCAACGRPVANLKSPTCVYCGAPIAESVRGGVTVASASAIPAELLVMLEPRPDDGAAKRRRWLARAAAVALAIVVMLILVRIFNPPS